MDEYIQDIYDIISDSFPKNWKKAAFYIKYESNSYCIKYYVKSGIFNYKDCYSLDSVSDDILDKQFSKIHSIVFPVRKKLPVKEKWSVLTIVYECCGKFNMFFDYEDHSKEILSWENEWRKKYLK